MLEEDLRSPCTEEIAVFQAFSRVIRESSRHFVVMDTAPTGHTLLLLDATGSYHRDISGMRGDSQARIVTPMMRLQDPEQTKMLDGHVAGNHAGAGSGPPSRRMRRAGIEPWGWIVNPAWRRRNQSPVAASARGS